MEFRIRPFRDSDIADINEIRSMRGVMETIPTLFSESVAFTEKAVSYTHLTLPTILLV